MFPTEAIISPAVTVSPCFLNITPLEPAWRGYLTIEVANLSPLPLRVYPLEGIAQIVFYTGAEPSFTYESKGGKYQNQLDEVVTARL